MVDNQTIKDNVTRLLTLFFKKTINIIDTGDDPKSLLLRH